MASPSDHELIDEIRSGRRDALGILFDRYSSPLYEFIHLLIGDRDQAARILEDVFVRVPMLVGGVGEHESVRGWLYSLAREASIGFLRQRGWLDALPPSDEPMVSGLPGDIWRAARTMPAFHRAVLIVEELHGLSPTEKARALSVSRTELVRLVDEARRSFNLQFDLLARQEGRPPAAQLDPERVWGIQRRIPAEGSLFGYLPAITLPASLAAALRAKIEREAQFLLAPEGAAYPITEEVEEEHEAIEPAETRPPVVPEGCSLPVVLTALLIAALITAAAACVGFFLIRDATAPTVTRFEPADKAVLAPTPGGLTRVVISASFEDNRAVDVRSVRLILDSRDVTTQALISEGSLSYPVDLDSGPHVVLLELVDTSGNKTTHSWRFTVGPQPEPTATPTSTPTIQPTATITRTPSPVPTSTFPAPPLIANFTANQTTVLLGAPVLLTWSVSNADIVFLNQDKVDPAGNRLVTPQQTTTYHLIANNQGGTSEKAITIVVQKQPDLVVGDITVNQSGQVIYVIRNVGDGDVTGMFLIQVYADGLPIDSNRRISLLPADQEVSLFVPNYTLIGTRVVTVRVNATQEIQETSYTNNELVRTVVGPTPTPTPTATGTPTVTPTGTPTNTPTATIPPPMVTSVSASLASTSPYTGTCPGNFSFSGSITTDGPAAVVYRWERSDGNNVGPFSLGFTNAGTQTVTHQWTSAPAGSSSVRLHVLAPNDINSTPATFVNNCH